MGLLLAFFCLANILFNLPVLSFYILKRSFKQLNNDGLKRVCGEMYENTKYDSKLCLAYTSLFILRRFLFVTYGLFIADTDKGGLQLVLVLLLNLFTLIYLVKSKSQRKSILNFQEWFNEFLIQACTIQMTVFTDFVLDKDV